MIMLAYLLGSISSAVLVCRIWRLPDPRTTGSKNPGATNVYRLGGRVPAALTLLGDMLKGTIPVWSGYFMGIAPMALGFIGVAACIGHIFPVFFNFKGGKGVATAFGALVPIGEALAVALIATWVLLIYITGYSSLAAIITAILAPIYTYFVKPLYTWPVVMLSILIVARHRENIQRLFKGEESKVASRGSKND